MGAWDLFVGLLGPVMVGLLLIVLGWAASERGRVHQLSGAPSARLRRIDRMRSRPRTAHRLEGGDVAQLWQSLAGRLRDVDCGGCSGR